MDLQTMKTQMNAVIQKHQIVVSEMRNDPQNPILQKRLHELQIEIASLNARQQQIFNEVRKKISVPNSDSPNTTPGFVAPAASPVPTQEIRMVCCTKKCTVPNQKPIVSKPCITNSLHPPVPPSLNNISSSTTPTTTITLKGPIVLPPSPKIGHHHRPLLVVPSPSNNNNNRGGVDGVLLNLVSPPPIRVPQYPPPSSTTSSPSRTMMTTPLTCQKTHLVNNTASVTVTNSATTCSSIIAEQTSGTITTNTVTTSSGIEKYPPSHSPEKINNKIDQKKKDFLTALGLVSRDSLSEMKNKKSERKRRSTANPQFSNAALEEKLKNAAAAQAAGIPQKRPRGRPRLESKPMVCSTNGVCGSAQNVNTVSSSDSPKMEPLSPPDSNGATVTSTPSRSSLSPTNEASPPTTLVNGLINHRPPSSSDEGKNVEQMLSGLCIVCTQPGDLVKCDTCAKQQHLACIQPPLVSRPQGPWQCSDCQSSKTVSLTVVQNYDVLKAAKEDEKRKLLKKSLELRLKRSQLEARLSNLRDLSGKQRNRQSELQTSLQTNESLIERIHSVISGVRLCS